MDIDIKRMVIMDIKNAIFVAMKSRDSVRANILRLVLSESERTGSSYDKIAEKLIESNNEALRYRDDQKLVEENGILKELIPEKISKEEIFSLLSPTISDIILHSEGKSIGLAMKFFKEKSLNVSGDDVKFVVKSLREKMNA